MCMKNVNATMFMCSSFDTTNNNVESLNGLFDSVVPLKDVDSYYLESFNIVLNGTIIFDQRYEDSDDYFKLNQPYEFMIRLTHVDSGLGVPLFEFEVNLSQKDLRTWCKSFYEFKKILRIPRICIPKGLGNYALKLLVRPKSTENNIGWNTQTIHSLLVGESRTF